MHQTCTWLLMLSDDSTIECVGRREETTHATAKTASAMLPPARSSVGAAGSRSSAGQLRVLGARLVGRAADELVEPHRPEVPVAQAVEDQRQRPHERPTCSVHVRAVEPVVQVDDRSGRDRVEHAVGDRLRVVGRASRRPTRPTSPCACRARARRAPSAASCRRAAAGTRPGTRRRRGRTRPACARAPGSAGRASATGRGGTSGCRRGGRRRRGRARSAARRRAPCRR